MDFATEYALRRLIHRSAELQDLGQVEELAQLFARGEIVFGGLGQVFEGVEGVRALLSQNLFYDANGAPADPAQIYATPRALHYVTNVDIFLDLSGAGRLPRLAFPRSAKTTGVRGSCLAAAMWTPLPSGMVATTSGAESSRCTS